MVILRRKLTNIELKPDWLKVYNLKTIEEKTHLKHN